MSNMISFEYDQETLFQRATERGYESIQTYLEALIEEDWPDPAEGLREALQELKEGKGRPVEAWLSEHDG